MGNRMALKASTSLYGGSTGYKAMELLTVGDKIRPVLAQGSANEQDDVLAIKLDQLRQPLEREPSAGSREGSSVRSEFIIGPLRNTTTVIPAEVKTAAIGWKDAGVSTGQARKLAEQRVVR